ncbi:MAG: SHOCT domain-containing protein [Gordonia sp. (in: high G+C Gram-positive bacteria)]
MMGWYGGDAGWAMMTSMVLFWLVVIGVVVWAIVRLTPRRRLDDDPRAILDRRLASGEIDEAEYRSRIAALREGGRSP